ncbi:specificity protein S [Betaproteobacteria bacterium]|nr:specificity protein S [Betaproteobacteria bacterium]
MVFDAVSVPLRELSIRITKGTTPTKGEGFAPRGVNYIKSECITSDGEIDESKFSFIDEDTHKKLARSQLRAGNVLFSMAGVYLGKTAIVLPKHLPANTNQAVGIITLDESKADSRFIHYTLQSPACRAWIMRSAAQSAQPNFNLQEIGDLPIPAISLVEQRGIAETLGALDDRIENLRQTNATLEAIAAALFKSWFVDFDGVAAAEMEESELGFTPKGWRAGTLADLCELNASKWTDKKHPPTVRYIDLSGVSSNRIETVNEFAFGDAPSRARLQLREGDTIVGTVRPGNRAFAYIHEPEENLTGSTGFAVLSPNQQHFSSFIYLAATRKEAIERLTNLADGAAYPAVRPNVVAETPCVIATDDVFVEFSGVTQPLLERIVQNSQHASTLAALRDALLPRLISGQLRVKDAEKIVERAT